MTASGEADTFLPNLYSFDAWPLAARWFVLTSGPICFLLLQLSAIPELGRIVAERSTGDRALLPYSSLAINGFMWLMYGYNIGDLTIAVPNASAFVLGCVYSYLFYKYAPPAYSFRPHVFAAVTALSVASMVPTVVPVPVLASLAVCCGICLMGAPLASVRTVFAARDASIMPFWQCLMGFINSVCWLFYGMVTWDKAVLVPNALGGVLAAGQLVLFMVFPPGKAKAARLRRTAEAIPLGVSGSSGIDV